MNEARQIMLPDPMEFSYDGRSFVQYGVSPVKLASLRASMRTAAKGTRKNPIMKDGKEYVYIPDGRLLMLEHFNRETVEKNTVTLEAAPFRADTKKSTAFEDIDETDAECPELTDEQIAFYLDRARIQKGDSGRRTSSEMKS